MTVLRTSTSPDGRYRAELHVLQDVAWAMDADPLTVVVYALPRDDGGLFGSAREVVPVPASAGALELRWVGPRHLVLACGACLPGQARLPASEQEWSHIVITRDAFPDVRTERERRRPVI